MSKSSSIIGWRTVGSWFGVVLVLSLGTALASAQTNRAAHDQECQARLRLLGDAFQRHLLYHTGQPPARLGELQSFVLDLETFSCPASGRRLTGAAKIDTDSDYAVVTQLGKQRPLPLLKERAGHHGGQAHTFYSDRTIKAGPPLAGLGTTFTGQESATVAITNLPAATNLPPIVMVTNLVVPPPPTNAVVTNIPSGPLAETLAQAEKLSTAGRYVEAVTLLDRVLAQEPANRLALWQRGVARTWTGDLRGSLADLDALLALDSANQEIRRVRTVTALALGHDLPGARAAAAELLRAQPNNAQVLLVAGQAELTAGNTTVAQQHFARATTADPQLVTGVYQQAGQFLQAGVPQMAYLQFIAVVWSSPNFAGGHYGAGMSAARLGFNPQAIQSLERFLLLDPNSSFATTARQEIERLRRAR